MELELLNKDELLQKVQDLIHENNTLESEKKQISDKVNLMIAGLTHEFKTPLHSIIGFSELLKYKTNDEKLLKYTNNILNCSQHLLSLVQNIIDITSSQYKPIELSYSIFNSGETIKNILENFNESNIRYTLSNINICADYTRFKQVIFNLISNSLKFGNNEHINILTYRENSFFVCEISDSGDGIDRKNLDKIFDFFTQVSSDYKKRQSGNGIGLSLCKTIVEAHKGTIEADSELGKGTTFRFKIPIDKVIS